MDEKITIDVGRMIEADNFLFKSQQYYAELAGTELSNYLDELRKENYDLASKFFSSAMYYAGLVNRIWDWLCE